jgi:asparagine synthase (glutamine-hydrolysing)
VCGIVGLVDYKGLLGKSPCRRLVEKMCKVIAHRGPDAFGEWHDPNFPVFFGHQRLSILDLSEAGAQPMHSPCNRWVLTYNGEIYNFRSLRQRLDSEFSSIVWKSQSDTEVLLQGFSRWGIEKTLKAANGMFAMAVWDKREGLLTLARDRAGEKPLYYGSMNGKFVFGSELKPFRVALGDELEIDREALCLFLRHNYVPAPYSIYKNVKKLTPGTFLSIHFSDDGPKYNENTYWDPFQILESGLNNRDKSESELLNELEDLLTDSVTIRMESDVPLGAFLSGGIDSSLICSLMQKVSRSSIKTFSIGFDIEDYNEAPFAAAVASHLRCDHTQLYMTPKDCLDVIPLIPEIYDEPFADSSQIPTYLVSKVAKSKVTVSLSGDAGDELFCGYTRYFWANKIHRLMNQIPDFVRSSSKTLIRCLNPDTWDRIGKASTTVLPAHFRQHHFGDKLYKLAGVLDQDSQDNLYLNLLSHWTQPDQVVLDASEPKSVISRLNSKLTISDFTTKMMFCDFLNYMVDDILVKVDRAAMAVSLETRVPFLDHRVVELAFNTPLSFHTDFIEGKKLLRKLLYKYVPRELIERPKKGFGVPIEHWLRHELRDWAEDYLSEERLNREGYFSTDLVRQRWREHLSGSRNWQYYLWDILMFEIWFDKAKAETMI